jgi:hypothetical protein
MKRELCYKNPNTLLNKGTGYLSGYTHSLNHSSYCYVRKMPVSLFRPGIVHVATLYVDKSSPISGYVHVETR